MKVISRINNLSGFADKHLLARLKKYNRNLDGKINIEIGETYTVYGILFRDNSPWYYLCSEDYDDYPIPYASECFEVIDEKLSACWKINSTQLETGIVETFLVFDEWAEDRMFCERLINGDKEAEKIFAKYRKLMDQE
ncbi:MAG: hypothetical protein AAF228_12725 [Pseudomonadota bacterium]